MFEANTRGGSPSKHSKQQQVGALSLAKAKKQVHHLPRLQTIVDHTIGSLHMNGTPPSLYVIGVTSRPRLETQISQNMHTQLLLLHLSDLPSHLSHRQVQAPRFIRDWLLSLLPSVGLQSSCKFQCFLLPWTLRRISPNRL